MSYKINHANIKEWAKNYDGPLFDGILCDPPYELGFMGKSWDSSGIAFDTEMWSDILKLLKPGGHLLAFSGSRTYHRMAVAIEDAGFEIRDMIEWVYGSGFPKSLNIGKAVDKIRGNEREILDYATRPDGSKARTNVTAQSAQFGNSDSNDQRPTKGTSEWEGYGTALKPAHEPCVLARKPIEGTVANNVLKHGTGGLNIDGTRVGTESTIRNNHTSGVWSSEQQENTHGSTSGRFPANLIHDGSDEVLEVFPNSKSAGEYKKERLNTFQPDKAMFALGYQTNKYAGDSGSASRFFYTAKASKSERNAGLEGFEEKVGGKMKTGIGGGVMLTGSGNPRSTTSQNHHPTVKPLSLTKYLATLIKPPTGGRLLVPFSGSGSEMIGALQAGWEYVEGVELTEEYIPIAEARIKYWLDKMSKEQLEML